MSALLFDVMMIWCTVMNGIGVSATVCLNEIMKSFIVLVAFTGIAVVSYGGKKLSCLYCIALCLCV